MNRLILPALLALLASCTTHETTIAHLPFH